MRTTVDDEEESLVARIQTTCCNTGVKQFIWGTLLIFFLILFIAMGGYYSRVEQNRIMHLTNATATICATADSFEEGQRHALQVVVVIGACFSMLGSSFIIVSFFAFPDLQTFPYKLIMFLSLADFFSSSTYIMAVQDIGTSGDGSCFEDNFMCFFSAGMSQYFDFASFLWMGVISFNIYQVLVKRRGSDIVDFEKYYHMVCWGVPGFFLLIVTATDGLGDAGNWCWIKHDHQLERWLCYYIPLILIMVFNLSSYWHVTTAIKKLGSVNTKAISNRMSLYVGAFIFIRSWSVLNRFVELVAGNVGAVYPLMFLHSLFSPTQGVANALVYGFNKKLKGHYMRVCGCDRQNSRQLVEDEGIENPAAAAYNLEDCSSDEEEEPAVVQNEGSTSMSSVDPI